MSAENTAPARRTQTRGRRRAAELAKSEARNGDCRRGCTPPPDQGRAPARARPRPELHAQPAPPSAGNDITHEHGQSRCSSPWELGPAHPDPSTSCSSRRARWFVELRGAGREPMKCSSQGTDRAGRVVVRERQVRHRRQDIRQAERANAPHEPRIGHEAPTARFARCPPRGWAVPWGGPAGMR